MPGLYLKEGFLKRISIAPDGCMSTRVILVSFRARTSRRMRSPKYCDREENQSER